MMRLYDAVPTSALTVKHPPSPSESFRKSATELLDIDDKFSPVAWRLMVYVPQVPGGVASVTILEATAPPPFSLKKVP